MVYIIIAIVLILLVTSSKEKPNQAYNASFESIRSITSIANHGFSISGGLYATTKSIAHMNVLVTGPTGSGKSAVVLTPSIFTLARGNSSMCVMDLSGDQFKATSGRLAQLGYNVYQFFPGQKSDCFNCLELCKTLTDIQKCATLIIKNSGMESKSDPYWSASGEALLSILMEYLIFYAHKKHCTMPNLVRLTDMFAANPERVDLLIIRTKDMDLLNRWKAINSVSEKTLQSTLSTVRVAIKMFGTPEIRKCTSSNSFDFKKFRKEKSILYITIPVNEVNFYAPLCALIFETLFTEIFSKIPERGENSIFCLIDEMVSMRFLSPGTVWSNIRKFNGGCLGLIQDEKMIEMNYSVAESQALKTNSYTQIFLPGQPLTTCKKLEEILGLYSYTDEDGIKRNRQLMTASEIRMCNDAIILCGNKPPIRSKLRPYYNNYFFSKWSKIPPYEKGADNSISEPELIPFDDTKE